MNMEQKAHSMLHQTVPPPDLVITDTDFSRLQKYLGGTTGRFADAADALNEELSRAHIVASSEAPPTLITMNSRVVFENLTTGKKREITLVYPHEADASAGCVSVLAPMGAALIGLSVGQEIDWPLPDKTRGRFRVVEVLYQPEADGRFDL